jgi:molecular chaperone DnaK
MGYEKKMRMLSFVLYLICTVGRFPLASTFVSYCTKNFQTCLLDHHSVGIDLGTTYSLVSVMSDSKPQLLKIEGNSLLPSVVRYENENRVVVGQKALNEYQANAKNTFHSVKRLIGRTIDDAKQTKDDKLIGKTKLTFVEVPDPYSKLTTAVRRVCALSVPAMKKPLLPEEISSEVLKRLIQCASEYYGGSPVTNAIITVPAYFDQYQRDATLRAGYLAGLKNVKLLKEPEAAAMAYGMLKDKPQLVLVVDLGGGTFDVSVVEVGDGLVEVIATSGDGHLGGDDFDQVLVDWVFHHSGHFLSSQVEQLKGNLTFVRHLTVAATSARLTLSKQKLAEIIFLDPYQKKEVRIEISRGKFESLSQQLLARMLRPIREAAIMAGINLPGESGSLGQKRTILHAFGNEDDIQEQSKKLQDNPKKAAELQLNDRRAANLRNKMSSSVTKEVRRLQKSTSDGSLLIFPGGQELDDVVLVGGASRMPCIVQLIRTLTGIDPKRSVSPDHAICLGAGILAGVLDGKIEGLQVLSPLQSAVVRLLSEEKYFGNSSADLVSGTVSSHSLLSDLFKTDVNSEAYKSRASTTKIQLTLDDDEDVREFLSKNQRNNTDHGLLATHVGANARSSRSLFRSSFKLKQK